MKFVIEELEKNGEKTGVKRVGVVPSSEDGFFLFEDGNHQQRIAKFVGLAGTATVIVNAIEQGEYGIGDFFDHVPETNGVRVSGQIIGVAIVPYPEHPESFSMEVNEFQECTPVGLIEIK